MRYSGWTTQGTEKGGVKTEHLKTNHLSTLIKHLDLTSRLKEICKEMFQNHKCMQLLQSLLFGKYTYSFFIIALRFSYWSLHVLCLTN